MEITIKYTFTKALSDQIYVERAERRTATEITVTDAQLLPSARADALVALTSTRYGQSTLEISAPGEGYRGTAASENRIAVAWSDPVSTEPTVEDAIRDVSTLLKLAAEAAPRILAEVERQAAEAEVRKVRALSEAIEVCLAQPLDVWLTGTAPTLHLQSYTHVHRGGVLPHGTSDLIRLDPRLAARAAEAEAEAERQNEAHEAARIARVEAVTDWIAKHAPDLSARRAEGFLPEAELLARARDHVFAALAERERYAKLVASDVPHSDGCYEARPHYSASDAEELTAEQFETLGKIRALAPAGATVEPRVHSAWCDDDHCDEGLETRLSVRVTAPWCGRKLSREYAL